MQPGSDEPKPKRPYEKPKLKTIQLAVDEVLGVGCKIDGGGFAFGVSPCVGNNCQFVGS
jgi:hypothetical protein